MSAVKQPEESAYYGYEFSDLLGANTIASVQDVQFYAEAGRGGSLTQTAPASIVGTQVRVQWGGGEAGTRYITTVKIFDSAGNPLTVSGEICVGLNCNTCDPCWPIDVCSCYHVPCTCPSDGTQISVYGGPLKREIINRAYGYCGQSFAEFEISPEEYTVGLQCLNDQMAVLGPRTGYNFPDYEDGTPEENSGLRREDVLGAAWWVAQLLAPNIGKDLKPNKAAEIACDTFRNRVACIPEMGFARNTIRGAGNRWGMWRGPYFPTGWRGHDRGRC